MPFLLNSGENNTEVSCTNCGIGGLSRILEAVKEKGVIKVMGSPSAIKSANTKKPGGLEVFNVL